MDKRTLSSYIEDEIKNSKDNIPKHIVFLHDPYGLTEDLNAQSIQIFGEDYLIVKYVSDFHLRARIEKHKDSDSQKFCIISEKKDNSYIQDYTGWRSNSVLLTPQRMLEWNTEMQWCESINIIGNHLAEYKKNLLTYRRKVGKPTILPSDAKAIIVSALSNSSFVEELTPAEAYFFLYPENNYKEISNRIPDLKVYLKKRLGEALPFIGEIVENEIRYQSFPSYLWLSYVIHKLGRNPNEYMRGISPNLYDRFERLKIRPEVLYGLADSLQRADLNACKSQVSNMEEAILTEKPVAERQFMKLIEPHPHDPLTYYSQLAERDKYTKTCLESLLEAIPNYIVSETSSTSDERLSKIIRDLEQHWFIENYRDHLRVLIDLKTFYEKRSQGECQPVNEISGPDQWISTYTQQIIPVEDTYSNIEINPQARMISQENRKKIRNDYKSTMWSFNTGFQEFITKNYPEWVQDHDRPLLTADFLEKVFKPLNPLRNYRYTYIIVIDCMRVDVWNQLRRRLLERFETIQERYLFSLIPSSTIFSRTSIFSGTMPRECITIPEKGRPHFRFGDEKRTLARALQLPSDSIEFVSQVESSIKIDEIDNALNSHKNLKVLVLDSVDNKIHRAGAEDRLGKLKQDFLDIYHTVIESIINRLEEQEDVILFITSDHGFVNTDKVMMVDREKGFVHPRYMDLNPEAELNGKLSKVIPAENLGITSEESDKRFAFPIGNHSFKLAREGVTVRKSVRDEVIYGHGGLTPQETIVPCAVLVPRKEQTLKPVAIELKQAKCMEAKESTIVFQAKNLNYLPMKHVNIRSNVAPPIYLSTIAPHSAKEFKVSFTPKTAGDKEIELTINYKLRDAFEEYTHREVIVAKENPEIVRRYVDESLDRLMG